MKRFLKSFTASVGAAHLAIALLSGPTLKTLRAQRAYDLETDGGDIGVQHAECAFFTDAREKLLQNGLAAQATIAQRYALTDQVAKALPKMSKMLPSRSRSGSSRKLSSGGTIDDNIFGTLAVAGVTSAPHSTDAEFLRRVTLDLTGRIPTVQEVTVFLADASPDKRAQTVNRLLDTPQWADRWTMFLGDLLRNTTVTAQVNRYPNGRDAFHIYLLDSLRANKSYDQIAREILAASGTNDGRYYPAEFASYEEYISTIQDYEGNPVTPTAASYMVGALTRGGPVHDTYDAGAFNVARDFLGVSQMDCILCHDGDGHLDDLSVWGGQAKRSEAWGLAAFFAKTALVRPRRAPAPPEGGQGPRPRWWDVVDLENITGTVPPQLRRIPGEYVLATTTGNRPERQPEDNGGEAVAAPVYPFGAGGGPKGGESRREALGRLLTADIQFARATVNYVWREFFSRGIVEPPDQFDLGRLDPANPPPDPWEIQPSHPYLLQALADGFVENGFDLKWLMREITNSRAYQLSSRYKGEWDAAYEPLFARYQAKRLSAEQIHDALVLSSGVVQPYVVSRSLEPVPFAMQFPDVQGVPRAPRRDTETLVGASVSFLDAFLRGDREETPRSAEATIIQALHLMNSPLVIERVKASQANGALAALLGQNDGVLVTRLYLRVLSRYPTAEELAAGVQLVQSGNRTEAAEDLMWSLYNKVDFIFNY